MNKEKELLLLKLREMIYLVERDALNSEHIYLLTKFIFNLGE